MRSDFIDREKELLFLHRKFDSGQPELLILRGRRRVGKTFLLKEFTDRVGGLYLLASITSSPDQLRSFAISMSQYFNDSLLEIRPFATWDEFFLYLNQHLSQRTAVVIDEYPYLLEAQPGLGTILQKYWDEYFRTNQNILLILNGSALSMMEKGTLNGKAPLYGRRTGQWLVTPMNVIDNNQFFDNTSLIRAIEWYSVTGGVPFYSEILSRYSHPTEALIETALTYGEVLYEEVEFLLRGEFRNPRSYFPILKALAQGSRKFGEISSKTGYDRSNLTKYLSTLESLHLIRREVPATEENPAKSKKGLFYLNDFFMNFWFRYVFPHQRSLETGDRDRIVQEVLRPTFDQYVSNMCEPVIRQLLETDFFGSNLEFQRLGRYWDRQTEIDIYGYTTGNNTVIGEIKWTASPVDRRIIKQFENKVKRILSLVHGEVKQLIISKSGFEEGFIEQHPQYTCIDLSKISLP